MGRLYIYPHLPLKSNQANVGKCVTHGSAMGIHLRQNGGILYQFSG